MCTSFINLENWIISLKFMWHESNFLMISPMFPIQLTDHLSFKIEAWGLLEILGSSQDNPIEETVCEETVCGDVGYQSRYLLHSKLYQEVPTEVVQKSQIYVLQHWFTWPFVISWQILDSTWQGFYHTSSPCSCVVLFEWELVPHWACLSLLG